MTTDGRHVLIERPNGPNELYDHETDPGELDEIWASSSATVIGARLHQALEREFAKHTRPGMSGLDLTVTGYGQLNPLSRGLPPEATFASRDSDPE